MSEIENINYTMYEEYYKKAKAAYNSGYFDEAAKLFFEASNSLLLAAKEINGKTQTLLINRAKNLSLLADSLKARSLSTNKVSPDMISSEIGNQSVSDEEVSNPVQSLDELLEELDSLIGLKDVKEEVKKRIAAIQVQKAAEEKGSTRKTGSSSLHMVFSGNPGTGKTTVARLIGKIYASLGVLKDGNKFIETDRSGLVGKYVGHTAQMVNEKVSEALGGILFIDEAYSLYKGGSDSDFGEEAVAQLVKCMEDNRNNLIVILAGYKDEMEYFIDHANPGLKSRFRNWIEFPDYSVDELIEIFKQMLAEKGMKLGTGAESPLRDLINIRSSDEKFGNARGVRNLLEDILDENNSRLAEMIESDQEPDFETIEAEDILNVLNRR